VRRSSAWPTAWLPTTIIALAIAVSKECDGCIASHARGAARVGATAQEVAETLGVAVRSRVGRPTSLSAV